MNPCHVKASWRCQTAPITANNCCSAIQARKVSNLALDLQFDRSCAFFPRVRLTITRKLLYPLIMDTRVRASAFYCIPGFIDSKAYRLNCVVNSDALGNWCTTYHVSLQTSEEWRERIDGQEVWRNHFKPSLPMVGRSMYTQTHRSNFPRVLSKVLLKPKSASLPAGNRLSRVMICEIMIQ